MQVSYQVCLEDLITSQCFKDRNEVPHRSGVLRSMCSLCHGYHTSLFETTLLSGMPCLQTAEKIINYYNNNTILVTLHHLQSKLP